MLIGRHESNQPSNNHYKESYKILWKKLFETTSWGQSRCLQYWQGGGRQFPQYG